MEGCARGAHDWLCWGRDELVARAAKLFYNDKTKHGIFILDGLCKLYEPGKPLMATLFRRVVFGNVVTVGVSPYPVVTDESVELSVLIGVKGCSGGGLDAVLLTKTPTY